MCVTATKCHSSEDNNLRSHLREKQSLPHRNNGALVELSVTVTGYYITITSTDSVKLERIQRKFAALCYSRFFNNASTFTRRYEDILVRLNLLPLHMRRRHLDAVFIINAFKCNNDCPSVLDSVSLRTRSRSIRDFSIFSVHRNFKASPSAR
jgi:hypothetical protein